MNVGLVTISLRVTPEAREKLENLFSQSELRTKGEFIEKMLKIYEEYGDGKIGMLESLVDTLKPYEEMYEKAQEELSTYEELLKPLMNAKKIIVGGKIFKTDSLKHAVYSLVYNPNVIIETK